MQVADHVYVFSYNRGNFLDWCVSSIERCLPQTPLLIIDDSSEDPETLDILKRLSVNYRVYNLSQSTLREFKTGGLSEAMNFAMRDARRQGFRRVLFIQDDMQIVRALRPEDEVRLDKYFLEHENAFQLSLAFVRRLSLDGYLNKHRINSSRSAYIRLLGAEGGKSNFCDTGLFDVERFFALYEEFVVGEGENSAKARSRGLICGLYAFPLINWLPYPVSFRGRKRTAHHLALEYFGGAGFHPIEYMSDPEVNRLFARSLDVIPTMEDFLKSPSSPRQDIWSTGGGEYNLMARGGLPAITFSALRKIKRTLIG